MSECFTRAYINKMLTTLVYILASKFQLKVDTFKVEPCNEEACIGMKLKERYSDRRNIEWVEDETYYTRYCWSCVVSSLREKDLELFETYVLNVYSWSELPIIHPIGVTYETFVLDAEQCAVLNVCFYAKEEAVHA